MRRVHYDAMLAAVKRERAQDDDELSAYSDDDDARL